MLSGLKYESITAPLRLEKTVIFTVLGSKNFLYGIFESMQGKNAGNADALPSILTRQWLKKANKKRFCYQYYRLGLDKNFLKGYNVTQIGALMYFG